MKIDFNTAWAQYEVGEEIRVSDSSIEPAHGGPDWFAWRSHNFTGTLLAKEAEEDGSRCMVIEFEHDLGTTAYHVSERVHHSFERVTATLDDLRASKWEEAKAARTAAASVVQIEPYGLFDADGDAKVHASGTVLMMREAEALGEPFQPFGWTMADNRVALIETMDELVRVGLTIGKHSLVCHAIGQGLRDQIERQDATEEEIAAIDPAAAFAAALAAPPVDLEPEA